MTKKGLVPIAVIGGTASAALSKWFLVWIFARSAQGPEAVGIYSSILAIATPLFVISQLGLRNIFISSITRWPWSDYVKLRIVGCVFGALLLVGIVVAVPHFPIGLGISLTALKIADSMLDIYLARLQYGNRLLKLGVINTLCGVVTILAAALVVGLTGQPTLGVVVAAVVSGSGALVARSLSRNTVYESHASTQGWKKILRLSIPVTTFQCLASVLFQLPIVALTLIAGTSAVGVYSASAYLLTVAGLIGATLETLLITPFRQLRERSGLRQVQTGMTKVAGKTLVGGAIAGVGVVIWGSDVLETIYGPEFALGPWPLTVLAIAATATVGSYVVSVALTVANRYSAITVALAGSCALSALAGLFLAFLGLSPLAIGTGMAATGATARLVLTYAMVRGEN